MTPRSQLARTFRFIAALTLASCGELVTAPEAGFDPIWRVLLTTDPEIVGTYSPALHLRRMPDNVFEQGDEHALRVTTSRVYAGWFAILPIDESVIQNATAIRATVLIDQGAILIASNYEDAPRDFIPFQASGTAGAIQAIYVPIDRSGDRPMIVFANGNLNGSSNLEILNIELVAPPRN